MVTYDDLVIEQGTTFSKVLKFYQSDEVTPLNLTGYTAEMQIRRTLADEEMIIALTTENNRITITPLEGVVTLHLTEGETTALNFDVGSYDLKLTNSAGEKSRPIGGIVKLSKGVTR